MSDTTLQAALRAAFDSKLSVIAQTLTEEQQTQAQTNLGGPFLQTSGGSLTGPVNFPNGLDFSVGGFDLAANSSGEFSWGQKSFSLIEDYNTNLIRFTNGYMVMWGGAIIDSGQKSTAVTLFYPFKDMSYFAATTFTDINQTMASSVVQIVSNTQINVSITTASGEINFSRFLAWYAVGYWK